MSMTESDSPGRKLFTTVETRFLAEGDEMDRAAQAEIAALVDSGAPTAPLTKARMLGRWGALLAVGAGALLLGAAFLGGSNGDVPPAAVAAPAVVQPIAAPAKQRVTRETAAAARVKAAPSQRRQARGHR